MAEFFHTLTTSFTVVDVVFAVLVIRAEGIKSSDNRWFALYSLSGAIWSFFFGQLIIQTDVEVAYLCRCFGLFGVFTTFIFITYLICSWSTMPKGIIHAIRTYALLGFCVYPFFIARDDIIFRQTSYGMSYEFVQSIWTNLYVVYTSCMALVVIFLLISMLRSPKLRFRRVARWGLVALFGLVIGDVLDTFLPYFGFAAIPGSTVMQFVATCVVFTAVNYTNKNKMTIANSAGFLFHSASVAVLIYDENMRLVQASDAAHRLLGLGDVVGTMTHIEDIFDCGFRPFEESEERRSIEAGVRGSSTVCGIEMDKLFDDYYDLIGYMVIVYDVTERRNFIEELQVARIKADEANKAKSSFLANMSHEIRTPINTVLGMNEMIRRENVSSDVRGYSENIKVAGETLLSIINDILDFSKVEAGRIEIVEGDYEFGTMLGGIMNMFELKSKEKALEFVTDIDNSLPIMLHGDEVRVRQILMNLLGNAVKYTEHGSVTLSIGKAEQTDESIKLVFEVRDTGIGIREEDKATLFDSFKRVEGKAIHHIEGTGLGLSIVKELVRLMGAQLDVESTYGIGSTFRFTLVQRIVDNTPIGDPAKYASGIETSGEEYHASFTAPEAHILAVDDNRMNLAVISGLLKKTRVHLDLAESGNECIDRVKHRKYDVILMDHMMPVMDGIETLCKMRELPDDENLSHDARVVALTANAIYGARETYLASGFDSYLSKPIESDKLEALLIKLLPAELVHEGCEEEEKPVTEGEENIRRTLKAGGVNPDVGLSYCGSFEVYASTAGAFCEMAGEVCSQLAHYREQRAVKSYQIVIHGIKANARTLGCDQLFRLALAQEDECKAGGFERVLADGDDPERMIVTLSDVLTKAFAQKEEKTADESSAKELRAIKDEELERLLGELEIRIADFEDADAVDIISELLECKLKDEVKVMLLAVRDKLKIFNYEGAAAELKSRHANAVKDDSER